MTTDSLSWQDETRLATIITWIAAAIAAFVAVSGPAAYFWLTWEGESKEAAVAARLHAAFVTQAIASADADWRQQVPELIEADLAPSALPEIRAIVDGQGREVARAGTGGPLPHLTRSAPLMGPDGPVGAVVIRRSLQPVLTRTMVVAFLGLALGAAIYASLRLLPLRALRRTLAALRTREAKAREAAEEHLRIVFEHSIEGIVLFAPEGAIVSGNPAAAQMFGYPAGELPGTPLSRLLQPAAGGDDPFPLQRSETRAWRKGGLAFPVDVTVSETCVTGKPQRIAIIRDITERKQAEERLSYLANYDSLTGLPNRTLFRDRLALAMERARRRDQSLALMFLDLDRFKTVNDSLGHDVGDQLLKQVAKVLGRCLRKTDSLANQGVAAGGMTVSRLGGDEFTILAEGLPGSGAAATIAERVLEALSEPFQVRGHEIFISTSIGIALYPKEGTDLDGLVKEADVAMYRAKELGRNTYHFYTDDLDAETAERIALEASLRHALARGEFQLHYQPKADLRTGAVTGAEALLRWQRPGKAVGPDKFIPILEETGLIVPVGAWVLRRACEQMAEWRRAGLPPISLAVNLSALQLRQPDLCERIADILADTGTDPSWLEVELTESMLMDDSAASIKALPNLASLGLKLAIDDFGTGHSSLAYLRRFSVDTLKIDRSFVKNTPDDPEDNVIASAIVALAHSLHLKVVAEGVETEAQAAFLKSLDCDHMQGYLLSRPLPPDAFAAWLRERATDASLSSA